MELVREQAREVEVHRETDPYLIIPNFYLKNKDYDNYYGFMNDIISIAQKIFNLKLFLNREVSREINDAGEQVIIFIDEEVINQTVSKFRKELFETFNKYYENKFNETNRYIGMINLKITGYDNIYFLEHAVKEWDYRKNMAQRLLEKNISFGVDKISDNLSDDFYQQKSIGMEEKKLIENPVARVNEKKNFFWNFLVLLIGIILRKFKFYKN